MLDKVLFFFLYISAMILYFLLRIVGFIVRKDLLPRFIEWCLGDPEKNAKKLLIRHKEQLIDKLDPDLFISILREEHFYVKDEIEDAWRDWYASERLNLKKSNF